MRWLSQPLILTTLLFLTTGCTPEPETSADTDKNEAIRAITQCEEPRPQICTREYNPVCASLDSGVRCIKEPCPDHTQKTYPSGCTACSDEKVIGYLPGAC